MSNDHEVPVDDLEDERHDQGSECRDLILSLPKCNGMLRECHYQYHGYWLDNMLLKGVLSLLHQFQFRDSDILLVSLPKSGTTWLKALAFAILNRSRYKLSDHPLLINNPHDLVLNYEYIVYKEKQVLDLANQPSPRLVATHAPYSLMPTIVADSNCKVVYICRNPKDTLVSLWHYVGKQRPKINLAPLSLEEVFDMFCNGISPFGPFWEHVLEHWKVSLERPDKVLFLKYEELKQGPTLHLKRLAQFIGYPFTQEEENGGVVNEIVELCSFENLSNLEVNKNGVTAGGNQASVFFRRGEVGDSANYLTPEMVERLDQLVEEKWKGSGLCF